MHFGVLGPLAVTTDAGEAVTVPGAKVRVLLAALLANRNQVVSAARLIENVWGDDPPADPNAALQVRVSQLRKALNDAEPGARELVESRQPGYVLRTDAVDADRFAQLAASGDADRLAAALRLWRGAAYADVADEEFVRAEVQRLTGQRLAVHERLAQARLARGEHDLVAADLAALVAEHPLHEGLRAVHIKALYAAGRQSDALDSYSDLRARLADELGVDPGPDLVALYQQVLAQSPVLAPQPAATSLRATLPPPLDELVGRAEALAELRRLLSGRRLVTLVGPGGVGKTRLAVEAAREHGNAHLVELAALPAGDTGIAERVLATLDVHEEAGTSDTAEQRLLAALGRRALLLVVDNCEHVVDQVAALVSRLLRAAPEVSVLATSREPLGLAGELVWEVQPLAVPQDAPDQGAALEAVLGSPAARLFAARASAQQRTFRLDERTAPAVARICRRLDGIPLALELAATRVRALGVVGVVERLDDRFALLTSRQRDVPERQRTLTAVIAWSWDLLDPTERAVLARLSVFSDGCTLDAADAVSGADPDLLTRLVERSLVVMDDSGAEPRYRLLESVAAFCHERLDDAEAVRARHAAFFTELAERADPHLRGPDQREWLERLDAEAGNLRAALAGGSSHRGRLATALTWYWYLRGRFTEARRALADGGDPGWLAGFTLLQGVPPGDAAIPAELHGRVAWFVGIALLDRNDLGGASRLLDVAMADAAAEGDTWTEAAALSTRAMLSHAASDLVALERDATRSDALFTKIGDRWGRLQANNWLGGLVEVRGEYDRAVALHTEGLRWAEELALWPEVCTKLSWLAWLAVQTADYQQARELGERAYAMAVESNSPNAMAFAELSIAFAARREGKTDLAISHLEHLVEMGRADEQPALFLPMVLTELGHAVLQNGDTETALALHIEAFEAAEGFETPEGMGAPRDAVSALEAAASVVPDPATAARMLGAAAAARSTAMFVADNAEQDDVLGTTARLVATMGEEAFQAAFRSGATVSPRDAIALAGTSPRSLRS
ncbi:BTAD domain-containing putative transcriptional regulator [Pseudonocardia sp. TRM90224]|uniref:BTAD domain-containing putative transcriptional regulator n=1 Tax=Pseudonocardia sp. TRM90224 TaxID=2812678 RepID=UPI001E3665B9|nr:BTAD domain-containing putative transcriptional regulator [Pseudonocardia sp. TRM90224]